MKQYFCCFKFSKKFNELYKQTEEAAERLESMLVINRSNFNQVSHTVTTMIEESENKNSSKSVFLNQEKLDEQKRASLADEKLKNTSNSIEKERK